MPRSLSAIPATEPLPAEQREAAVRLAAALRKVGYTVDGVRDLVGDVAFAALHREQVVPVREALRKSDAPLATVARAMLLGEPVDYSHFDAAVPGAAPTLLDLGLARGGGRHLRLMVDLRPYQDWYIVSDLGESVIGGPLRPDHVLGVGGASTTLAASTVREHVSRTLDLGTGSGIQALHAAGHSDHVVATDTSERALQMTRITLALNGIENVELRRGDLFEPVAGEEFNLIVSNPPFVITPRLPGVPVYEYRDAGRVGDELVSTLIRETSAHLAPGGIAQLLANWEVHEGVEWTQRVGRWMAGTGLDAWVVQREEQDPAEYAELWIRDSGTTPGAVYEQLYAAWLEDFSERHVESIGFGLVTLRKPVQGRYTLNRLEDIRTPTLSDLGVHVGVAMQTYDDLAALSDEQLLDLRWRVAPDVTEQRHYLPGAADPSVIELQQNTGFRRRAQLSSIVAGAVGACDGELNLHQICAALSGLLDVDTVAIGDEVAAAVRELAFGGFLVRD